MFSSKFVVCFIFTISFPFLVDSLSTRQKDRLHKLFEREGEVCLESNILTEEDVAEIHSLRVPSSDSVGACFLACVWKKMGLMNNSGMLQQNLPGAIESVFSEYELGPIEAFYRSCLHMNLEVVSDGEKGCERAVLSFKCIIENAPKIAYVVVGTSSHIRQYFGLSKLLFPVVEKSVRYGPGKREDPKGINFVLQFIKFRKVK